MNLRTTGLPLRNRALVDAKVGGESAHALMQRFP